MALNTFIWCAVIALLAIAFAGLGHPHQYVFDQAVMKDISREVIAEFPGANATTIVHNVISRLQARYPKYINDEKASEMEWMFNNAGGAMGAMTVLHASFSEYVIIFGTALGTEGHTGRFFADDYFTILYGEQHAFPAGSLEKEVYGPGDQHHLPYGSAKQYLMPDTCWALEYARGNIPFMMPFGLFDTFFSTLDMVTLWQTVRVSAVQMLKNALNGKI